LISSSASLITTSVLLLNFAPIVIPVIALIAIPRALNDKKYRRLVWKFGYENTEGSRQAYTTANALTNAQTLKEILVNNALGFLDKKFTEFTDWYIAESLKLRKKWFVGGRIYSFLDDISISIGYLIIFSKFLAVKITVGNVIFQLGIVDRFSRNLTMVTSDYNNLIEFSIFYPAKRYLSAFHDRTSD